MMTSDDVREIKDDFLNGIEDAKTQIDEIMEGLYEGLRDDRIKVIFDLAIAHLEEHTADVARRNPEGKGRR